MGDFALRLCENIRVGLNFFWPVYIVCAKCQKALVNTLVQADFPVYALSKHNQIQI